MQDKKLNPQLKILRNEISKKAEKVVLKCIKNKINLLDTETKKG